MQSGCCILPFYPATPVLVCTGKPGNEATIYPVAEDILTLIADKLDTTVALEPPCVPE